MKKRELSCVDAAINGADVIDFDKIAFDDEGLPTIDAIRSFVAQLPENEQRGLIDADGQPTRAAQDRLRAAVFAAAYENEGLIRLYAQALDANSRNLIFALEAASGKVQRLKGLPDGFDIRDLLAKAAERVINEWRKGTPVDLQTRQLELTETDRQTNEDLAIAQLATLFAENAHAPAELAAFLGNIADILSNEVRKDGAYAFLEMPSNPDRGIIHACDSLKHPKMSLKALRFWAIHGDAFFEGVFNGKDVGEFFVRMRKASDDR